MGETGVYACPTPDTVWRFMAVCRCLSQATVSRQCYCGTQTDLVWHTNVCKPV
jgi:hypothetical protein